MKNESTFSMISQGCRLNHAETASLVNELTANGLVEVDVADDPSLVVINTCTVTENGDKDTARLIRKINAVCSNPRIALIGCQSQIKKADLLALEGVKWVIGNEQKNNTVSIILSNNTGLHLDPIQRRSFSQPFSSFDPRHTRVNLKIQDGCDFYCSFCIIPFARGPARSRDFQNIMDDATALIPLGVNELVLTGINLGTYANSGRDIYDVLRALLSLDDSVRIRISSIEPTTIDDRLIELWQSYPNFCRHLHLPIQSGSDEILKKMRRKYTRSEYGAFVESIAAAIPNICIGTDVIVGFPGETNDLFDDTAAFLSGLPIHYFHVFRYSERTMAHSRRFDHPVSSADLKQRSHALRQLHGKKWAAFMHTQIGTTVPVLFEQKKQTLWQGSTDHFIKVRVASDAALKNHIQSVRLTGVEGDDMTGVLA